MDHSQRIVLFLNENPIPLVFTQGTISGKELRLRAAIDQIDEVHCLAARGQAVTSHKTNQTPLEEKIIIHHLPPCPYYLRPIPLFFMGLYWARKLRPFVIEAESPHLSGVAAIFVGKLLKIPVIIEVRATLSKLIQHRLHSIPLSLKRTALRLIEQWSYSHATLLIANSQTYHSRLKKMGFESVQINPGLQYPPKKIPSTSIPRDKNRFVIGYLGRLVPEKGVDQFLKAIAIIANDHSLPPFHAEIGGDGVEKPQLIKLVQDLDIAHLVTFLGQVENYPVLSHWDILVNPCLVNHPLEMVNAEAALMGVPVVCFGNQVYPETVVHNQTGLKVLPKSAPTLASALRKLLKNPNLLNAFKSAGRDFAVTRYDFQRQVNKLQQVYRQLHFID